MYPDPDGSSSRPNAGIEIPAAPRRPAHVCPSIVLGEIFPAGMRAEHDMFVGFENAVFSNFYSRCEIPVIEDGVRRHQVRQLVKESGIGLTCWTSEIFSREEVNLSSLHAPTRIRSVAKALELMRLAGECGADALGILSGPDPGESKRPGALVALADSLIRLGHEARYHGNIHVVIEPLDRDAHKKGLIGPTESAIELLDLVRKETDRVWLAWDSGHVMLNGEDPVESLNLAAHYVYQMHLSNPVVDRTDSRFGDHHYPVGSMGAGTPEEFARIIAAARRCTFAREGMSVALEVRTQGGLTPAMTMRGTEDLLRVLLGSNAP